MWNNRATEAALALAMLSAGPRQMYAQDHLQHAQGDAVVSPAAQPGSIGRAALEISCLTDAKMPFGKGMAHLHSFSFLAARRAFQDTAKLDPECAMAYWGEAISYYDWLFQPPAEKDVESALQALEKAASAATRTDREREYVAAARALFVDFPQPSRLQHDTAYGEAMARLSQKYPDDQEAKVLHALSLLGQARRGVSDALELQMRAAQILEPLLQTLPEHPGVAHYLIHAYDDSGLRSRGLAAAEQYARIAPEDPHALHMPSHIFGGLGMWDAMVQSNEAAFKIAPSYYHALTWMVYGMLQQGRFLQARVFVDVQRSAAMRKTDNRAERSALLDMEIWLRADTRSWKDAAAEPEYWSGPLERAAALYLRGMGSARLGDEEAASRSLAELQSILTTLSAYDDPGIVVRTRMATVQAKHVQAAIHQLNKRGDEAIAVLREAAALEDSQGVSWLRPDSGTAIPSRELLGELFLDLKRPKEAIGEFEQALRTVPGRLRSVHGLARAAALTGNRAAAEVRYKDLLVLLADADIDLPELEEIREYLAGGN